MQLLLFILFVLLFIDKVCWKLEFVYQGVLGWPMLCFEYGVIFYNFLLILFFSPPRFLILFLLYSSSVVDLLYICWPN